MPQIKKQVEVNNFSGGFNTEQSPLRADPSTTLDEQNMILAADGSRARRYGLAVTQTIPHIYSGIANAVAAEVNCILAKNYNVFLNPSVDSSYGQKSYSIITLPASTADTLIPRCYALNEQQLLESPSTPVYSTEALRSTIPFNTAQSGNAVLLPTQDMTAVIPDGDATTSLVELASIRGDILTRDFWGVDDLLEVSERPTTLSEAHAYNLGNQGWTADSIAKFFTEVGVYPSNADAPYFGLLPDTNSVASPPPNKYDVETLKNYPFSEGAPKGHYLLRLGEVSVRRSKEVYLNKTLPPAAAKGLFEDLNNLLGLSLNAALLDDVVTGTTFSLLYAVNSIAAFLGRNFYTVKELESSDLYNTSKTLHKYTSFKNGLFFTRTLSDQSERLLRNDEGVFRGAMDTSSRGSDFWTCASILDPTKEDFQPFPTDGGFLMLSDAEELLGAFSLTDSLIVIGTNGVWEVRATDGISPQNFLVTRLSYERFYSVDGVVAKEGALVVPSTNGLVLVAYDAEQRRASVRDISSKTIKRFLAGKGAWFRAGVFDFSTNTYRFLLRTPPEYTNGTDVVEIQQKELILDGDLGSFSVNAFPSCTAVADRVEGAVIWTLPPLPTGCTGILLSDYMELPSPVELGSIATPIDNKRNIVSIRYVGVDTSTREGVIASYQKGVFSDFGENFSSYMVTNPFTLGDTIRRKDITYLWTHFNRSEDGFEDDGSGDWVPTNPSGCLLSARWDFSDDASSGKWTTPRQVYRLRDYLPEDINDPFTYGQSIITTKNNVTGSGKALSLKFESDGDKDLQIIGWGAEIGIGGAV